MFDYGQDQDQARRTAEASLARLDALVTGAAALGEPLRDSGAWTGEERARALRTLDRLSGVLATVRSGLLVSEQHAQTSLRPGDRDFTSARARVTRTGLGEARREVRQAETLVAVPAMASAVADGRVPLPHVDALARVAASLGGTATLERADIQERLVGLAQRLTVTEFSASAARLLATHDPASLERGVDAQRSARFFVMSHQPDGTFVRGRLDRLSGEVLRVAIASVGQAPDEGRDKPQADADALVALAERALSGMAGVRPRRTDERGASQPDDEQDAADAQVSGVASRPTVSVLVPAATFAELRKAERRRRAVGDGNLFVGAGSLAGDGQRAGDGLAGEARLAPVEPATLDDGTPLAMSQVARILCDCEIGRVVLSADGLPLDVGRTRRLFTAAQRRAVVIRDRACAWNGCDVPAAFCEIHHIRWWDRDRGPTDLDNGVLLCSHHHHTVHRQDLTIIRLERPPEHAVLAAGTMPVEPMRYSFRRRDGAPANSPAVAVAA